MDRPNFHFRRREEKLDWKKLAALDVDQIAKTVDYRALQESIRQITYCDAGREFDSDALDPNLVKVFRMAQLIIEYLLQSQDFLANNLASVEQRLNTTLEELEAARQRSRRDQEGLRDLRKSLRAPASSTVMTLTGHQRCQFCQKVFINTTYLQSHMMRRHNHMVSKQPSNQTLSTVTHDQSSPPGVLEAELEQVRRRLLVAEQQLCEERRRVAALERGPSHQPAGLEQGPSHQPAGLEQGLSHQPAGLEQGLSHQSAGQEAGSPTYQETIKEEPEPPPEEPAPPGSAQGSGGGGSQRGSGRGSPRGSGGGSRQGSAEQRDSQLALLLERQAAEIKQLREELERQQQAVQRAAAQQPALLGGSPASRQPPPEPSGRVEQEIQKQARRDVAALEGQMEAQERYWQHRLSAMRHRHDAEVQGMRRMLNERSAAAGGSAEYVNIASGPEQGPRLLRFVRRHQSPSPGQRPRPCLAARRQRRSRSVSGCRRLQFADDEACEGEEEGPARGSRSTDALTRERGRPQVRRELEAELNERLLELGIEPGTRRISSGLMADKMKHLQLSRQVLGFGELRRQADRDLNQRLTKFSALPTKRSSKLTLFAKDMMHRGAEMSRSLVSLGTRGLAPCSSATVDAQLMKRLVAAERAGRPRAASDSPSSGRRARPRQQATSYKDEEDFRPRQGGRNFKFKANASKHILERFTRRGQCQSSLIKSTTIHRVDSGQSLDGDGGDRYERLREERPPAGRPVADRQVSVSAIPGGLPPPTPPSLSGSVVSVSGLRPPGPTEDGFTTPLSRPASGVAMGAPDIPQVGSGPVAPKQESFDDSEMSAEAGPSPPPHPPTAEPLEARPSGSANTLSTSQWNSAADAGATVDTSAADETETRTSRTTDSPSSAEDSEDSEGGREGPGDR